MERKLTHTNNTIDTKWIGSDISIRIQSKRAENGDELQIWCLWSFNRCHHRSKIWQNQGLIFPLVRYLILWSFLYLKIFILRPDNKKMLISKFKVILWKNKRLKKASKDDFTYKEDMCDSGCLDYEEKLLTNFRNLDKIKRKENKWWRCDPNRLGTRLQIWVMGVRVPPTSLL